MPRVFFIKSELASEIDLPLAAGVPSVAVIITGSLVHEIKVADFLHDVDVRSHGHDGLQVARPRIVFVRSRIVVIAAKENAKLCYLFPWKGWPNVRANVQPGGRLVIQVCLTGDIFGRATGSVVSPAAEGVMAVMPPPWLMTSKSG